MDNPFNQTDPYTIDASLAEDERSPNSPHSSEQPAVHGDEASFPAGHGVLSIVPAPRPYAYRRPIGHPEEDDTAHPLRRRNDFDPQK